MRTSAGMPFMVFWVVMSPEPHPETVGSLGSFPQCVDSWWERVPKVELHDHLEGAIPLDALWTLVCKYGGDPAVPDVDSQRERFSYVDFTHFIATWVWKNRFLREYEDFTFIAEAVARDLARQNIVYAEAFFSPGDFHRHGLGPQELARSIRRGLDRVPEVDVRLVADLVRDFGPAKGALVLEAVGEVRDQGIVGIGIGGSEQLFPPAPFKAVYERARELGFRTSAHAGEAAGADSIWGAIRTLQVDRIGHGTRAAEDPQLLEFLAERRIPLEMCPISNLRTGVVTRPEEHPVRQFVDRGLLVTVNTDDPAMFGNSLAQEYQMLEDLGMPRETLRRMILDGVAACWLPGPAKAKLRERIQFHPSWGRDVSSGPVAKQL